MISSFFILQTGEDYIQDYEGLLGSENNKSFEKLITRTISPFEIKLTFPTQSEAFDFLLALCHTHRSLRLTDILILPTTIYTPDDPDEAATGAAKACVTTPEGFRFYLKEGN